ncbi:hypothetical protein [Actinocatenispora comari]|uniref:Uncharacterized protein n=1 Tax=Actinocatenispora comari TaxID=2807577 RepID=A0A8J4AEN8_9ACTN|nr:hypothetical protein [Actinocatenispora comari]GIL29941.1 hypothetical protein NUM_51950 [Actinocatenispora comari]
MSIEARSEQQYNGPYRAEWGRPPRNLEARRAWILRHIKPEHRPSPRQQLAAAERRWSESDGPLRYQRQLDQASIRYLNIAQQAAIAARERG